MTLIRQGDLRKKGISWTRAHIANLERDGKFPKRVKLGAGTVAWVESEVDQFVANLAASFSITRGRSGLSA
jgi:prophage regulatory protein